MRKQAVKKPLPIAALIPRFLTVAKRGFCTGVGEAGGQMCVEAAIQIASTGCLLAEDGPTADDDALAHDEIHANFNDSPDCVNDELRSFKISLNDEGTFEDDIDRAMQLVKIGILQLGTGGLGATFDFETFKWRLMDAMGALDEVHHLRHEIAQATNLPALEDASRDLRDLMCDLVARDLFAVFSADDTTEVIRAAEKILIDMRTPGAKWLAQNPGALKSWRAAMRRRS